MRWFPFLVICSAVGCSEPVGGWEFVSGVEQAASLSTADFERLGEAEATFSLPAAADEGGAFYRLTVGFERGGTAAADPERVFLRVSPRFDSFDGTAEVTSFLLPPVDDDAGEALSARLVALGSLERCEGGAPCERTLGVFTGWLAPPGDGATLELDIEFAIELRGGGPEEPPAEVTATGTLTLGP